jgi:hypothetical protein
VWSLNVFGIFRTFLVFGLSSKVDSNEFSHKFLAVKQPSMSDLSPVDSETISAKEGPVQVFSRLMMGSTRVFKDIMLWRSYRALPEDKLSYEQVFFLSRLFEFLLDVRSG